MSPLSSPRTPTLQRRFPSRPAVANHGRSTQPRLLRTGIGREKSRLMLRAQTRFLKSRSARSLVLMRARSEASNLGTMAYSKYSTRKVSFHSGHYHRYYQFTCEAGCTNASQVHSHTRLRQNPALDPAHSPRLLYRP